MSFEDILKSRLVNTSNGTRTRAHIIEKIQLDELLPHLSGMLPLARSQRLEAVRNNQGNRSAMVELLNDVFRYDNGVELFSESLRLSGHRQTSKNFDNVRSQSRIELLNNQERQEQQRIRHVATRSVEDHVTRHVQDSHHVLNTQRLSRTFVD